MLIAAGFLFLVALVTFISGCVMFSKNKNSKAAVRLGVTAITCMILVFGILIAAVVTYINRSLDTHTAPVKNTSEVQVAKVTFPTYTSPAPTDSVQLHTYTVAKAALDKAGAHGYNLTIDAPWLDGDYGKALILQGQITVGTNVPEDKIASVALHEYAHVEMRNDYNWSEVEASPAKTLEMEKATDVRACQLGATYVHYIGTCPGS